jgi:uncharacterized RDD family membrane protein YckC
LRRRDGAFVVAAAVDSSGGIILVQIIIGFVYTVGLWTAQGATLGKMALGIKIVRVDGQPIGFGAAFVRYIGYIVSWIILGIGYLMIAFRRDKRGLHDLMADTVVIKRTHLERYVRSRTQGVAPEPAPGTTDPWQRPPGSPGSTV